MGRAWMPLYVGDYLRDTRDLNTLQHGAYLLLIMHYWQHDALPTDDARLAAIAGLSVAQWRRIRAAIEAKFGEGWRHKRIDAEIAKVDRALLQRRLAGRNGGIKSGIARAVLQGEAILRAEAEEKRSLARRSSGRQAQGQETAKPPPTKHNHRFESSLSSLSSPSSGAAPAPSDQSSAPAKPASAWSRRELDALFARRSAAESGAPSTALPEARENNQTGD